MLLRARSLASLATTATGKDDMETPFMERKRPGRYARPGLFICPSFDARLVRRLPLRPLRMESELLHAPIENLGHIERVLGRTGDLMDPAELAGRAAAGADHPQELAVERELVDSSRER